MSRARISRLESAFVLLFSAVIAAPADQLWNQAPDPAGCGSGLSSQDARNPGGFGWFSEVADNFAGLPGWTINEVDFNGSYGLPPGQVGHTQGFTVRFYSDDNGRPGTLEYEADVLNFTETQYCVDSNTGIAGYCYTVQPIWPFSIVARGQHWLSVVAILDRGGGSTEPPWDWTRAANIYPPSAMQWYFDPGNFQPQGVDVTFTLVGTAGGGCHGDFNCDGKIDFADIDPFIAFLSGAPCCDPTGYNCSMAPGPPGPPDFDMIDPFVALLSEGATCP